MSDMGGLHVAAAIDRAVERVKSPLTKRDFMLQFILLRTPAPASRPNADDVNRAEDLWNMIIARTK